MQDSPNRMLEFLTAPAKPDGEACRSNRRRRSSVRVELAWYDGINWRSIRGRLRDISKGGASLLSRSEPPMARSARLRLVEGDGSPWIEAQILGIETESSSRHRIRMKFEQPCPSFLLGQAILGTVEPEDDAPAVRLEWVVSKPGASR